MSANPRARLKVASRLPNLLKSGMLELDPNIPDPQTGKGNHEGRDQGHPGSLYTEATALRVHNTEELIRKIIETTNRGSLATDPERFTKALRSAGVPELDHKALSALPLVANKTTEHQVHYCPKSDRAVKILKPGSFGMYPKLHHGDITIENADIEIYLDRIKLTNIVFAQDLNIEGFTLIEDMYGDKIPSIVHSQTWFAAENPLLAAPEYGACGKFMREMGFRPGKHGGQWYRSADSIYVADGRPDNFIQTKEGVVPIDLLITKFR